MVGLDLPALVDLAGRSSRARARRCSGGGRSRPARTSVSIVSAAPPAAGSTVSVTALPLAFAPVTLVDRRKSKPCFLKILLASLRTSPSMPGRIWSRNSTTVTSAPSRRQTEPSSSPITPPPMTTMRFGTAGKRQRAGGIDDLRAFIVHLDARQRSDRRAGGDDDVLRGDRAVADLDRVRPRRRCRGPSATRPCSS